MSSDNYCYLVIDELDNTGVIIDAADPDAVQVRSLNRCFSTVMSYPLPGKCGNAEKFNHFTTVCGLPLFVAAMAG